jgi:hypothetical protein
MTTNCELCGEPMPAGEEMFKYHGSSGPCPKPPKPSEEPRAVFQKQHYGAVVATIHETPDGLLEVQKEANGTYILTVHSRVGDKDRFDDVSIKLEPKHFAMLGSIATMA